MRAGCWSVGVKTERNIEEGVKRKKKTEKHGNSDIKERVRLKTTFVFIFDRNTFKHIHQCIHMWQLEIGFFSFL